MQDGLSFGVDFGVDLEDALSFGVDFGVECSEEERRADVDDLS